MIKVLDKGVVDLVDKMENDVALKVVNSARISFDGKSEEFTEKDQKLAKYLYAHNHTSPYRHSYYTFRIKMPIFVARQIFKHQVGSTWRQYEVDGETVTAEAYDLFFDTDKGCSWNELSGRYSEFKPEFYVPERIRGQDKINAQGSVDFSDKDDKWHSMMSSHFDEIYYECYNKYVNLLEIGFAKEMARMVLPMATYTDVYWTISLQALIHFLGLRLDEHAQWETRQYAEAIYILVKEDLDKLGITREDLVC